MTRSISTVSISDLLRTRMRSTSTFPKPWLLHCFMRGARCVSPLYHSLLLLMHSFCSHLEHKHLVEQGSPQTQILLTPHRQASQRTTSMRTFRRVRRLSPTSCTRNQGMRKAFMSPTSRETCHSKRRRSGASLVLDMPYVVPSLTDCL